MGGGLLSICIFPKIFQFFFHFEVGLVSVVLTFGEKWDYLSAGGHDTANENTKMSFISSTRAF